MYTTHTSRSQSRTGSHLSHEEDTRALQLEIDHLKRKLRHERQKRTPSNSDFSFDNEKDGSYRRRSRTPPKLLLVSLSLMLRSITMSAETRIHLRLRKRCDEQSA